AHGFEAGHALVGQGHQHAAQSRMRWRRRLFGGGLAARLWRNARGLEINVLDSDDIPAPPRMPDVRGLVWFDYGLLAWPLADLLA
ncbi:hypothetical protein, partial [Klebsiella pneumoniae]|uniref:hypothetical protein n=1 Tax=Klebsiella pneumoniae TaxID=573 RepID=UPI0039C1F282